MKAGNGIASTPDRTPKQGMLPSIRRIFTIVVTTVLVAFIVWPFHDRYTRYGLPLMVFITWAALLACHWKRRPVRILLLALPILSAIPFCLPSRPIDGAALRTRYVEAMTRFEGTRYLWGGESRWGIDCSGLPRRAMRDALWNEGFRHRNGAAFRLWVEQWWFDTSAKALGEGYRGFTRPLGVHGSVREMATTDLLPGDLAVTADGRHVMLFLAPGRWIQADPIAFKVTIRDPEQDWNPWFGAAAGMYRWRMLE